jgi:hypothetical protein
MSFFLVCLNDLFGQDFKGIVVDSKNNPVENVAIYSWESIEKSALLTYAYSDSEGKFELPISKLKFPFFLEISCIFCETQVFEVLYFSNDYKAVVAFKDIALDEVELIEEKPVTEKKDTTVYDVKNFLNGTENKVEDLLKKLPGITVNESTGQIKFKGKDIELVQLDGDDLFGSNYTLGTKNISIDMVEEIQAIENFSNNPLFKDIEDSDKTILNLTLKKNKFDFSNEVVLKNGFGEKFLSANEITTLGVNKFIKCFGILAYQNFGVNSIDYRYDEIENYDTRFCNENFKTTKNISESNYFNQLPAKRTNYNESIFASFNSIFKISKRIKVKTNLNYFADMFNIDELIETNYFENNELNQQFELDNNYFRNPKIFKVQNQLSYNVNNNSLLEYKLNWFNENVDSGIKTILNSENYNSNIKTNNQFLKSDIEYTYKINNNNVFKIDNSLSINKIPQRMFSSPGNLFVNNLSTTNNLQDSEFQNKIIYTKIKYLFKINDIKNVFFLGYSDKKLPFQSSLTQDGILNLSFLNDVDYSIKTFFSEFTTSFKIKNVKTRAFISANHYNQNISLNENVSAVESKLAINYSIITDLNISKNSSLLLNYEVQSNTPYQDNIFNNYVTLDNTSIKNNLPSLDLIKNQRAILSYKFKNMNKLFLYDLNLNYSTTSNTFLTKIDFSSNFITYTSFQSPQKIETKKIDFNIEKYIKPLRINIKCNLYHSLYSYFNSITNFEIRENNLNDVGGSFFLITILNFPVNFESKLSYIGSTSKSDDGFRSERESFSSLFNIIIKPWKNVVFKTGYEYYKFDLSQNEDFSFLDANLQFNNKKNNFSFSIQGNNLLNKKLFSVYSNNDYSTTLYQSKLLPRYALVTFNFKI